MRSKWIRRPHLLNTISPLKGLLTGCHQWCPGVDAVLCLFFLPVNLLPQVFDIFAIDYYLIHVPELFSTQSTFPLSSILESFRGTPNLNLLITFHPLISKYYFLLPSNFIHSASTITLHNGFLDVLISHFLISHFTHFFSIADYSYPYIFPGFLTPLLWLHM